MHAESNRQVALRSHLQFISLRLASPPPLSLFLFASSLSLSSSLACFYFVGLSLHCRILLWLSLVFELCQPNWSPPFLPSLPISSWKLLHSSTIEKTSVRERGRGRERANPCEMLWRVCEEFPPDSLPPCLTFVCVHPTVCPCMPRLLVCVCVCVFAVCVGQCESSRVEWSGVDCLHLPLKCELLSELVFRIFLSNLFVVCSYLAGAAIPSPTPLLLPPLRVCVGGVPVS